MSRRNGATLYSLCFSSFVKYDVGFQPSRYFLADLVRTSAGSTAKTFMPSRLPQGATPMRFSRHETAA